jgi:ABC-type lipoprotein export system ATPase subunit
MPKNLESAIVSYNVVMNKMPSSPVADRQQIESFIALFGGDAKAAAAAVRGWKPVRRDRQAIAKGPAVVTVTGLSKHYKVGKQKIDALKDVSLEIKEGEFVAFTGPSGSGKSTLLQLIGGLDKPSAGTVIVDNKNITKLNDRQLSLFRNKTIGFVFQFFYLQPFLRLQTNLEVPAMFARVKRKDRQAPIKELSEAVGLSDRLRHLPKELSGGQMQRAAIARALLNKPKLILADEPTGNLDSTNGSAIIDLFDQVRREFGTTIIVVTHDPKVAARADREVALHDGVIKA